MKSEKSIELLLRFHLAVKALIYVLRVFKKREYDNLRLERTSYLTEEENKENNVYHLQNAMENAEGTKKERWTRVWENNVRRRSSVRNNANNSLMSSISLVNEGSHSKARHTNLFSISPKIEMGLNWTFLPYYALALFIGKIINDNKKVSELIKLLVLVFIIVIYGAFTFIICWLHGDIFWSLQRYWNVSSLLFQTFLIAIPNFLFFQSDLVFTLAACAN